MMKRLLLYAFALLTLSACGGGDDELPEPNTGGGGGERYFTVTNIDTQYDFTYNGGIVVHPNEKTQAITLTVDKADFDIIWYVAEGERGVKQTLHIDMTGKPYNITENYDVKYE